MVRPDRIPTRCMFDLNGGCTKPNCLFTHRSDPGWADAAPPRPREGRGGRGDRRDPNDHDASRGRRPPTGSRDDPPAASRPSWPSSTGRDSGWATKRKSSGQGQSSTSPTGWGWGAPPTSRGPTDSESQPSKDLRKDKGKGKETDAPGWGNSDADATGWGTGKSDAGWGTGWGSSSSGRGNDDTSKSADDSTSSEGWASWGNNSNGWNTSSTTSGTADTSTSSWGGGGWGTDISTPVERLQGGPADNIYNSTAMVVDHFKGGSANNRQEEPVTEGLGLRSPTSETNNDMPPRRDVLSHSMKAPPVLDAMAIAPKDSSLIKLGHLADNRQTISISFSGAPSSKPTPPSVQPSQALQTSAKNLMKSSVSLIPANRFEGPRGRSDLYRSTLKHMQVAAMFQVEYNRAVKEFTTYNTARCGNEYLFSTKMLQKMLDDQYNIYKSNMHQSKKKLDIELEYLIALPDFSKPVAEKVLDAKDITHYTQALQTWFKELETYKQLLEEKLNPPPPPPPKPTQPDLNSMDVDETSPLPPPSPTFGSTIAELTNEGIKTWKTLCDVADALEKQIQTIAYEFNMNAYTEAATHQEETLEGLHHGLGSIQREKDQQVLAVDNELDEVSEAMTGVESNLQKVAEGDLADLILQAEKLDAEHRQLILEKEQLDLFLSKAEAALIDAEQSDKATAAIVDDLTAQMKTLHSHRLQSPDAPLTANSLSTTPSDGIHTFPTPAESIDLEEIIKILHPIIAEKINADLNPLLEGLQKSVAENQVAMKNDYMSEVVGLKARTDEVLLKIKALSL